MIHYGKPYLEANGAIVAGIALGSLVDEDEEHLLGVPRAHHRGALMDWLALSHRNALPKQFWPPPQDSVVPAGWLSPDATATARAHAGVWVTVIGLMLLALVVRLVVDRVRSARALAPATVAPDPPAAAQ